MRIRMLCNLICPVNLQSNVSPLLAHVPHLPPQIQANPWEQKHDVRYINQQLLISITLQLRHLLHPFRPRLLHDRLAGAGGGFVVRHDVVEGDVLVEGILEGGRDVVAVVVVAVLVVAVT